MIIEAIAAIIAIVVLTAAATFVLDRVRRRSEAGARAGAEEDATRIVEQAKRESDSLRKEAEIQAKDIVLQAREQTERQSREHEKELAATQKRAAKHEESLARKVERLNVREEEFDRRATKLDQRETELDGRQQEYDEMLESVRAKLEEVAGLTRDEAKSTLLDQMMDEARHDAAKQIRQVESEAREEADRRAKKIVSVAIERLAGEFVAERTVSVVPLPSDDMKGRIIGREGRNIRAIESATGVDLIIDDTPEVVVVSCHNPVRRELARLALERLMSDGRIHPGRIEEVVRKAEQELDGSIRDYGQKAIIELGLHGVHPELVRLVGMLRYRYSYAQNVLMHSIECGYIAGALAGELGLNVKQARRAGLLHDIGKALTHEVEGSHAVLGGEIARKYGESAKIVNAIAAHHEEVKAETILAPLVDAADALSGARPGARREVLESYAKRLEELEEISNGFQGVQKSFAVQAGREVRIIVDPGTVPDDRGRAVGPRHRPQDRERDDLPRADQSHGDSRDAGQPRGSLMIRVLFLGDVVGRPGRRAVEIFLRRLPDDERPDFVIANAENASGGRGVDPRSAEVLQDAGVDVLTSGNHVWQNREILPYIDETGRLLRPINFPPDVPGQGYTVRATKDGAVRVGVLNVIGARVHGTRGLPLSCSRCGGRRSSGGGPGAHRRHACRSHLGEGRHGTSPRRSRVLGHRDAHARSDRRRPAAARRDGVSDGRGHVRAGRLGLGRS